MKAEIELNNGECVILEFDYHCERSDFTSGPLFYAYEIHPDFYTPFNQETGEPLPPVKATGMELTAGQEADCIKVIEDSFK